MLDFDSDPWPSISDSAKDIVRRMLIRNPKKCLLAHKVLCHPWLLVDGMVPDKALDSAFLSHLKQFSAINKLKNMALKVACTHLGPLAASNPALLKPSKKLCLLCLVLVTQPLPKEFPCLF